MIRVYGEFPSVRGSVPEDPPFAAHKPDFSKMKKVARKYRNLKNVIVIGNGGSINSFRAIAGALKCKKRVALLDTMEPEVIKRTRSFRPRETVVIPVSKSGNTVGVLEDLLYLVGRGYKNAVAVTGGGALKEIAMRMKWDVVEHPNIGGRFAGMTSCALLPALVCGLDAESIFKGARKVYASKKAKNGIFKLAKSMFELEKVGYDEIFMPIYSELLGGFTNLITQLVHETTGKNELGQTIVTAIAPESQHHTNQRFFGGVKNMVGFFIVVKNHEKIEIRVPKKLNDVKVRGSSLSILNGLDLAKSIHYEFEGVLRTTHERGIPYAVLELDKVSDMSIGELIAFWQMFAYYSAIVRGQNPFDQPEVERSKEITFELIRNLNERRKK